MSTDERDKLMLYLIERQEEVIADLNIIKDTLLRMNAQVEKMTKVFFGLSQQINEVMGKLELGKTPRMEDWPVGFRQPRLKPLFEIPEEEKQSSFHATIQLISGSDAFEIERDHFWNHCNLTNEDFNRLQSIGLKGRFRVTGCGSQGHAPFKARTLIVARHQIKEPVDLPQPNNCEIIYCQVNDEWEKIPADAPVLKKRFRLSLHPTNRHLTRVWSEAYFGSEAGGGGYSFDWERVDYGASDWKSSTGKNQQYDGIQLIVNDLPQHDVVIHDSSNPTFKNELSAFYLIPLDILNDVLRYSIVVQNNTMQYITALTVIWRFYPSQGAPILQSFSHSHSDQMFSDPTQGLIKPNGRFSMCLLLPGVGFSREEYQEIKNNDHLQIQLNNLNTLIARSEKWSVDIDGVLFSNGIFVGPDSAKSFDCLNARYKGARDLIEELMQKLNNNQPYADVFAHAQSIASIEDVDLEAPFPDFRERMRNPVYIYNTSKAQMGRQVIARRNNFSEQAAIDFIIQSSKFHIPLVKR